MPCRSGYQVKEICGILGIRKNLVHQTLHYHTIHGLCYKLNTHKCGWHRKLILTDINFIKDIGTSYNISWRNPRTAPHTTRRTDINFHTDVYLMPLAPLKQGCFWPCTRAKYWAACYFYESDGGFGGESMFGDKAAKNERTSAQRQSWLLQGIF